MPDIFDRPKRSEIMSLIRSKNTKAEIVVFRYLKKENVYFQKHYKRIPGNPDIALPRKKKAVFIDGDFWHGREYQKTIERLPKGYWKEKIERNVKRDKKSRAELAKEGWSILQVWESDINRKRTQQEQLEKIAKFLKT
jgi:DNA mismatch endonuclease (patch repair protein)